MIAVRPAGAPVEVAGNAAPRTGFSARPKPQTLWMVTSASAAAATLRMWLAFEATTPGVAANGALDDGHIDDVVVAGSSGQSADCRGPGLREVVDVATLEQLGQLRLRTAAPALGEQPRGHRCGQTSSKSGAMQRARDPVVALGGQQRPAVVGQFRRCSCTSHRRARTAREEAVEEASPGASSSGDRGAAARRRRPLASGDGAGVRDHGAWPAVHSALAALQGPAPQPGGTDEWHPVQPGRRAGSPWPEGVGAGPSPALLGCVVRLSRQR